MHPLGLRDLRARVAALEQSHRYSPEEIEAPPPLKKLFPGRWRLPWLMEWVVDGPGTAGWSLAIYSLMEMTRDRPGRIIVVDPLAQFHWPGLPLCFRSFEWIIIRPVSSQEALWAWEQILRSPGVRGAVGYLDRADDRQQRRLQLAAERGQAVGAMIRPSHVEQEPTWSHLKVAIESLPRPSPSCMYGASEDGGQTRRMRLKLLHAPGGVTGGSVEVEWDETEGSLSLAGELARTKTPTPRV